MHRPVHRNLPLLTLLLLALSPGGLAWAQDTGEQDSAETAQQDEPAGESPDVDPEIDEELDAELESENYADAEEEDFVPTEDIPTDQSIPFPADI